MDFSKYETIFLNKLVTDNKLALFNVKDYSFTNYIFPQIWSTAYGGFESRNLAGKLRLKQYTHVIQATFVLEDSSNMDFYGVFFDGSFAYYIEEPSDRFMHDLHEFKLKCKGDAIQKYLAKC